VCAQWYAYILQDIYLNVKYFNSHWNDAAWQVNLISGALFTFDANDGSQYLDDTYWYGKNVWAWDWTHQQTGSYPLDGTGMHLYVEQGSSVPSTVTTALNKNLNGMWSKITSWEGSSTPKKIWISEFGWESANVTEQGQADNLKTSYNLFLNDNRIALATWFTLSDWPGASWGLYNLGSFSPSDQKIAYSEFLKVTNCTAVGIEENNQQEKPKLFFNNTTENYYLILPDNSRSKIEMWNMLGERIAISSQLAANSQMQINISKEPKGIYFLKVESAPCSKGEREQLATFKIVF
jgi:hypothetical protein